MLLHVEVTEDDCRAGVRRSIDHCPIALALARAAGRPARVCPSFRTAPTPGWWYYLPGKPGRPRARGDLPDEAADAAESFDDGHEMLPFAFDLELPEEL